MSTIKKILKKLEKSNNLSQMLEYNALINKNKTFLVFDKHSITFDQTNKLVDNCCGYLASKKLKNQDIVSIVLKNSIEFIIIYFACMKLNLRLNPLPYYLSPSSIKMSTSFLKPKLIITDYSMSERIGKKFKYLRFNNFKDFEKEINNSMNTKLNYKNKINDVAMLYYSSGTTGKPKLIEYSHKAIIANQVAMIKENFTKIKTVHLALLPLSHTAALRYSLKQAVCLGSKVFICESFWKVKQNFWKTIYNNKITFIGVVPSIINYLMSMQKKFNKRLSKNIDFFGCGSFSLGKNLQIEFEKKFNVKLSNLYGLSEAGLTHFDNPNDKMRKIGSIGKVIGDKKIKILNKNKDLNGEIAIKSKTLFSGYYGNKQLYKNSFKNGFFLTGDLGFIDKNDYFFFQDRKKDIIIKGGINISSIEIENTILRYNNIKESAVIPVTGSFFGENILAFITLKNKNIKFNQEILKKKLIKKLGFFKTPNQIRVINDMPKTSNGKIKKILLKQYI